VVISTLPTAIAVGPFTFYLYGLGLATAAWVSYRAIQRRLSSRALPTEKWAYFAAATIGSGLLGARAAHVATNWSYYRDHLSSVASLWQGGLASFGGIAVATPVALVLARRWWPQRTMLEFADILIPAIVAGWALGRALGPQFMYAGGGHETHQWFGLTYAGQTGRRVPVPLIQAAEDGLLWLLLLRIERLRAVPGTVTGMAMAIWGTVRFLDEYFLLGEQGHSGSLAVQGASLALAVGGLLLLSRVVRQRRNLPN
jgi:phosphatidylglycerol:prolipoprotein diacylglycerol transferase